VRHLVTAYVSLETSRGSSHISWKFSDSSASLGLIGIGAVPFVELLRKRLPEILEDRRGGDNSRLTILLSSQLESLPDDRVFCEI
jgi:hypothetical protein